MRPLLLLLLLGCAKPQLPVRIFGPPKPDALDRASRALAFQGQMVASVDRQTGVLTTQWVDTGFMYGQIENITATIVRRYLVVVGPNEVTLRADTRRCARGAFSVGDSGLQGTCQQMDGLVPKHQDELNSLGAYLETAL